MAVEYKTGGNIISKGLFKILTFAILLLIISIALALIANILSFLGFPTFLNFINSTLSAIDKATSTVAIEVKNALQNSGVSSFLSIYGWGIFSLIMLLAFFWKLIFRAYFRLILRPYMVITTVIAFFIFYFVTSYFGFGTFFLSMLEESALFISTYIPKLSEVSYIVLNFISTYSLEYVFAYYVILYLFSFITVWLSYSSKMDYLKPSSARDECIKTLKEARKKTITLPIRMKFYVSNDNSFNAFAFAHNKVAINTGTLKEADEEVLRGVVAHELGHIAHLDVTSNTIAQANFFLIFAIIMIPANIIASTFSPKEGEKVNIFTYVLWLLFFFLMRIVSKIMNSIHYACYLIGGKRSEYKADKFAVKIGEAKGLLRFMAAFIDEPSGGFSDPHPSTRNRLSHILSWIDDSSIKEYENIDTMRIRQNLL